MRTIYFKWPVWVMPRLFVLSFLLTGVSWGCGGQVPDKAGASESITKPTESSSSMHEDSRNLMTEKDSHNGKISVTQTNQYPSLTYHFHDDNGKEVKAIRRDQFPIYNPVFNLPFPRDTAWRKTGSHYLPLSTFNEQGKLVHHFKIPQKVQILNGLKKYGLVVRAPETASQISIGEGTPSISAESSYLLVTQTAMIQEPTERERNDADGNQIANTLLDCSHICVYNHLGVLVYDQLIPDKLLNSESITNDGRYIFCGYEFGNVGEGTSYIPGGFLIIDTQTKKVTPIDIPIFKDHSIGTLQEIFADGYFQIKIDEIGLLYINPYTRTYYTILYEKSQIKGNKNFQYKSFEPFEGMRVDLSKHEQHSY